MKKLDSNEYYICRLQGKIFEASLSKFDGGSPLFIKRFLCSNIAKAFDDKSILFSTVYVDDAIDLIEKEYRTSSYGRTKYAPNELYWIGYFYRVLCFYYGISSKAVYKIAPPSKMRSFYDIGHTFDPEEAAKRFLDDKDIDANFTSRGVMLLKRYNYLHKLESMIGSKVKVYIDRPIGYNHDGIEFSLNYGYIKELTALDDEYQDAYILGIDEPIKECEGKVIAIINRKDDIEDKLVVTISDNEYSNEEINRLVDFQEKYFKHKIIR